MGYTTGQIFNSFAAMRFADIPGNEETKERLVLSVKQGRVAHAQLFLGSEGSANFPLALAYAQYIFCTNKQDNDSCGECRDCTKTSRLVHPDLHFSFPFFKDGDKDNCDNYIEDFKKMILESPYPSVSRLGMAITKEAQENKQPNITADECRNLIKKLSFKSLENPYKIIVLWMPEYLGKEGNMLLKFVEEPPENTVILMVCNDEEKLIKTIRSRVQLVKIKRFSDDDIRARLEKRDLEKETIDVAVRLSNGNLCEAENIALHHDTKNFDNLKKWLNACNSQSRTRMFSAAEELSKTGRESQKQWLHYVLILLNEAARYNEQSGLQMRLTPDEQELVKKLAPRLTLDRLSYLSKSTSETIGYIERNSNARISLMNLSLTLADCLRS